MLCNAVILVLFTYLQWFTWKPFVKWCILTWWQVISKADQTNIPERTWAATVFKNIPFCMIAPLPDTIMVMLDMPDFEASRADELFSVNEAMSSEERFIWNRKKTRQVGLVFFFTVSTRPLCVWLSDCMLPIRHKTKKAIVFAKRTQEVPFLKKRDECGSNDLIDSYLLYSQQRDLLVPERAEVALSRLEVTVHEPKLHDEL